MGKWYKWLNWNFLNVGNFFQIDRSPSSSRRKTIGFWTGAEPLLYQSSIQISLLQLQMIWFQCLYASDPALILHFSNSNNKHFFRNSKTAKHDQIDLPTVELTDLHSIGKLPRAWLTCEKKALICYISNNFGQHEFMLCSQQKYFKIILTLFCEVVSSQT